MTADTLSARLVEIESMLDRSRRRFEEGQRLVEEAHAALAEAQQALLGSPVRLTAEDSEEASSRLLDSLQAEGNDLPETLCGGRLAVDPIQRLIRIDGHPIGITEMEYRVLELLALCAQQCRHALDAAQASLSPRRTTSRSPRSSTCSFPSCARNCARRRAGPSSSRRSRSAAGSCATSSAGG